MDNQKLFLVVAIFLTVFLLWGKWELQQTVDSKGNVVTKTVLSNSVPSVNKDLPQTQSSELPNDTKSSSAGIIKVETDLLSVEIDKKGGSVTQTLLKDYPLTLGSDQKFRLLKNDFGNRNIARSGLIPDKILPTHHDNFTSTSDSFSLTGESLIVPLFWESESAKVTKNFRFKKNSYLVEVDYEITNKSNSPINATSYVQLARNAFDQGSLMMPTFTGGARFDDEDIYHKYDFDEFSDDNDATSKGGWIGMVEHYFLSAWIPNRESSHKYSSKVYDDLYMMQAVNPPQSIAPGQTVNIPGNSLFVGPKLQEVIDDAAPGMDHTVDYSWLYIVAKPMAELMHWINKYVNSWGWTIIIFTILIKLVFYKLSEKSYKNMAAMKLLAPRINQLKETYGDDKQKFGQKTMELYRKEKVNPAAGCLPILVQIPVFISLYWVLLEMVELRQTPFLYLNDLADMDQFFILPIIMVISMIVQQKLNPPPTDPTQAKIMMALPYVFGVFFLWFPSGLVLYWVANNILSILQQWVINKRISG